MSLNRVGSDFINAATPSQFDSSTSVATTEFVQRALGGRRGFVTYSSSTALTSSEVGKTIQLGGAGGTTVTLPSVPAGSIPGQYVELIANSSWSIIPYGSELIGIGGGTTVSSVQVSAGDTIAFVSGGNGSWYLIGGSAALRYTGDFSKSLLSNGYQKIPGGLVLQWGRLNVTGGTQTILTFPIAFPIECLSMALCVEYASIGASDAPTYIQAGPTASNVTLSGYTTQYTRWIAIGH